MTCALHRDGLAQPALTPGLMGLVPSCSHGDIVSPPPICQGFGERGGASAAPPHPPAANTAAFSSHQQIPCGRCSSLTSLPSLQLHKLLQIPPRSAAISSPTHIPVGGWEGWQLRGAPRPPADPPGKSLARFGVREDLAWPTQSPRARQCPETAQPCSPHRHLPSAPCRSGHNLHHPRATSQGEPPLLLLIKHSLFSAPFIAIIHLSCFGARQRLPAPPGAVPGGVWGSLGDTTRKAAAQGRA